MSGLALSLIADYEKQFNNTPQLDKPTKAASTGLQTKNFRLRERWRMFGALFLLDIFFCCLVIGPAVISVWRGVWDGGVKILEWYEVDAHVGNVGAFVCGFIFTLAIDLFHTDLQKFGGKPGTIKHHITFRLFSLCWGIFDIFYWKGIWDGLNELGGEAWYVALATMLAGIFMLMLFGVLKSSLSMPIGISVDEAEEHFYSNTFLQADHGDAIPRWLCDGLLSRWLELCVVLSWHGIWTLTDNITMELYSLSFENSTLVSLLFGLSGTLLLLIVQSFLLNHEESRTGRLWWISANHIYTILGIFVTISWFRATWYGIDAIFINYFPTKGTFLTYFSPALLGWTVLMLLGCCSCMHAGIFKDDPKLGISITFYYFSHKMAERLAVRETNEIIVEPI